MVIKRRNVSLPFNVFLLTPISILNSRKNFRNSILKRKGKFYGRSAMSLTTITMYPHKPNNLRTTMKGKFCGDHPVKDVSRNFLNLPSNHVASSGFPISYGPIPAHSLQS